MRFCFLDELTFAQRLAPVTHTQKHAKKEAKNRDYFPPELAEDTSAVHLHVNDGHEVHEPQHEEQDEAEHGEALHGEIQQSHGAERGLLGPGPPRLSLGRDGLNRWDGVGAEPSAGGEGGKRAARLGPTPTDSGGPSGSRTDQELQRQGLRGHTRTGIGAIPAV